MSTGTLHITMTTNNETPESVVHILILIALSPWILARKWDLLVGGPEAECKWDGHVVEDPDLGVVYSYQTCDRCGEGVRVR